MSLVWRDGIFLPEEEFTVSPTDRALCHGLSLFETILGVNGQAQLLFDHLERMRSGLKALGIRSVELASDDLCIAMRSLLERNGLDHGFARLRLTVSLGNGALNHLDSGSAWVWITASQLDEMPETVSVTSTPWQRDQGSALRGLKSGNYAEHLIAMDLAHREGFGEILFFNRGEQLCEAAMSNVFLIQSGELLTPELDSGCLAGVTRAFVIRHAALKGIVCREKAITRSEVEKADAMFLTSSIRGPIRVSAYGDRHYDEHPIYGIIRSIWMEEMTRITA